MSMEEGFSAGMVSSFLEIAVGQTADTARHFLQATGWKLEEAIQHFYVGNEGGLGTQSAYSPPRESDMPLNHPNLSELEKELVEKYTRQLDEEDARPTLPMKRGVLYDNELEKELVEKYTRQVDGEDVRPPLPVKRDVLYDSPMLYSGSPGARDSSHAAHSVVPFRNFEEEMKYPGVWETEGASSSSAVDRTQDNLASLYRPPFALMFHGPFEKAKDNARMQNKWLIVNMQSTKEFSSHTLNRDTWANEAIAQTIKTNFIFWQVYDDTEQGSKVCTYYKLDSIPVILVIDPITGQKMHAWRGMVQPEKLLEDLLPFMDSNPSGHHVSLSHKRPREASRMPTPQLQSDNNDEDEELQRALAVSMENFDGGDLKEGNEANAYLPLPEEPKGEKNLICRVGVRLPDGRRVQRNFLRTDPVQLLWSFCYSELGSIRPFRLTQAIPGASRFLDFDAVSTFEESGLANSMVSVTWEE
ncbi:plant UBX domain-containing protein 7-like [Salvia miltiorrhiza]|uniref:plant UBX domain-containing protein 7-like n=1 Tax=Salvia miltiorrhiza TaxID=226208 RepID=UPI0025AC2E1C|nr:plant UBX domain-containing protein 7-like [Salvia miltiorrhiza]XP_057777778.1 plant UBX domain-containing protein 7-like [Salvia miltiorrhiza]